MIEPLRYNAELSSTFEITRPVFCGICLSRKKSRANPNIATKYCAMCVVNTANGREHGTYLCKDCDELQHNTLVTKAHIRQIIVIGPGIRKKMLRRGDGKTFPLPLDTVKIRYRSTVYHMGKKLHTEPTRTVVFTAGLSGKTIHVQLLGARNLVVGDTLGETQQV